MKIFISQPMKNETDEEIKATRKEIAEMVESRFPDVEIEVIDSFFENAPHNAKPLWYLAKSLELMSEADMVCFAKNFRSARGCVLEYECARKYNYPTLELG